MPPKAQHRQVIAVRLGKGLLKLMLYNVTSDQRLEHLAMGQIVFRSLSVESGRTAHHDGDWKHGRLSPFFLGDPRRRIILAPAPHDPLFKLIPVPNTCFSQLIAHSSASHGSMSHDSSRSPLSVLPSSGTMIANSKLSPVWFPRPLHPITKSITRFASILNRD